MNESNPDRQKKLVQLKVDSVWPSIKDMQFDRAKQFVSETEFDVREVRINSIIDSDSFSHISL